MTIEQEFSTMAAALTRIANALELISAGGSPDVKTAPKGRGKAKTTDATPTPAAAPTVPDALPGFTFPDLSNAVPPAAEVQEEVTAPAVMPAFNMEGFLGQDPMASPANDHGDLPCPFEGDREGFKNYMRETGLFLVSKGISPMEPIMEIFSRFGANQQSQILEAQFQQVYNAFEKMKGGLI
jgi:hypothetical protein